MKQTGGIKTRHYISLRKKAWETDHVSHLRRWWRNREIPARWVLVDEVVVAPKHSFSLSFLHYEIYKYWNDFSGDGLFRKELVRDNHCLRWLNKRSVGPRAQIEFFFIKIQQCIHGKNVFWNAILAIYIMLLRCSYLHYRFLYCKCIEHIQLNSFSYCLNNLSNASD